MRKRQFRKKIRTAAAILLLLMQLAAVLSGCSGTANPETAADAAEETSAAENRSAQTEAEAAEDTEVSVAERFADQGIGVITGSIYDKLVQEYLPNSAAVYFNTVSDMALALDSGKISAYVLDEPSSVLLFQQYPNQAICATLEESEYAFIFPKDNEKSEIIRQQMNEYLEKIRDDGTLALLEDIWFGTDERIKTVDYTGLTGENGTLDFGITTDVGAPFAYMKDNNYVGYDVDMAVHFCQEYGYAINVVNSTASGMLASVSSGKCDFGASTVAITEERKKSMDFSDPNYVSSIVLIAEADKQSETYSVSDVSEELSARFSGQSIAVVTGSFHDTLVEQYLPESTVVYIDSAAELGPALDCDNIAGYVLDKPLAQQLFRQYKDQYVYTTLGSAEYSYFFPKNSEKSALIRKQMNEFLTKIQSNGTMEELENIWFDGSEQLQTVDYENLSAENGTLRFAISTDVGAPFIYMRDNQYIGYEVDLAVLFCREYGYGIEIVDTDFSGLLTEVSSGKCDFGAGAVQITEERKETVDFSEPNCISGVVLVVKQTDGNDTDSTESGASDSSAAELAERYQGKTIGVISGSVYATSVANLLPNSQCVSYDTMADLAQALENGSIDAYMTDTPLAQQMLEAYDGHTIAAELDAESYSFVFAKNSEASDALREEFNGFIAELRSSGEADAITEIWLGTDESVKVVNLDNLTGENGTLRLAVSTDVGTPFSYLKNGRYVGMEVDIAARFCRAYGYGLEIVNTNFSGMLVAVSSGKCDFAGSCIMSTEERQKTLNFSISYYEGSAVLVEKGTEEGTGNISTYDALRGKRIGVVTGMICDTIAMERIPDCEVVYFDSNANLAMALDMGKIDAYMTDEPIVRLLQNEYTDHCLYATIFENGYGYIYPKYSERSDTLREQMNEFLQTIREDGTLQELDDIWFGEDESEKTVDYSNLTGENGTLSFATTSSTGAPFCYLKNGQYIGYDLDIVVRFCRAYGYNLQISDYDFSGMLAAVTTGKCDFGGSCITITEERKESVNFSDPNYMGGLVLVIKDSAMAELNAATDAAFETLRGSKIGVLTGTIFDALAAETIPGCERVLYNTNADLAIALETGKIDAYLCDEPTARILMNDYEDQEIYASAQNNDYAFIFSKTGEMSDTIRNQMNEFLEQLRADGTLSRMKDVWLGTDEESKTVDYSNLTGENGTLYYACSSSFGAPFCYLKDETYVGYEIDLAVRFCTAYGYGFAAVDLDFDGVLTSVASGRCDFGGCAISITAERMETINFSDSIYAGGSVFVVRSEHSADDETKSSFLSSVRESFERTFLREARWKLFVNGIGVTLLITVLSAVCGTLIGFLAFLLYRKHYRIVKAAVDVLSDILQKTPVVVILMILYYIIFVDLTMDSVWVSCIGFSLIFSASVVGLLKVAVGAVDSGQTEAALALGYTDTRAFLRIVLPQSMEHFLPNYRSEIVSLIKSTAVVGYIAVQDLTKISDIVRSRTYEAFFPLIATAVIYFALAWILTLLVRRIQIRINPKRRSKERVLKGVRSK